MKRPDTTTSGRVNGARSVLQLPKIAPNMRPSRVAQAYAEAGLSIFPCQERGKKIKAPYVANGLHDAVADPMVVSDWWARWPKALIGLRTGSISGFWVLDVDIDPERGIDGHATLKVLERKFGTLPETLRVGTPRGGVHLYFRVPLFPIRNTAGTRLGPGLDVRGDGGYVIARGSVLADGRRWQ